VATKVPARETIVIRRHRRVRYRALKIVQ
jgi:hypothetical protein